MRRNTISTKISRQINDKERFHLSDSIRRTKLYKVWKIYCGGYGI
jgi:hypothetical protein